MHNEQVFDPWKHCRRLGIEIKYEPLRDARGYTDGTNRVWLHDGLTRCEERVSLTHEIVHVTQGHCGAQPSDVESLVCMVTARWLIPWHHLMGGWSTGRLDVAGVAQELCVTPEVVLDRVGYATKHELSMLEEVLCGSLAA